MNSKTNISIIAKICPRTYINQRRAVIFLWHFIVLWKLLEVKIKYSVEGLTANEEISQKIELKGNEMESRIKR